MKSSSHLARAFQNNLEMIIFFPNIFHLYDYKVFKQYLLYTCTPNLLHKFNKKFMSILLLPKSVLVPNSWNNFRKVWIKQVGISKYLQIIDLLFQYHLKKTYFEHWNILPPHLDKSIYVDKLIYMLIPSTLENKIRLCFIFISN